ncbi:FeoB-associated Cys-rich membrane protein [Flavobacterium columnare]|uniref:FeoB-associated Cys-rich membrane protein n=1 Tax=Flavobacterium columnare TaxID=996 RepID=A0A2T4HEE0_9FLAO|nr:FeoB-associated Cys-rich membrane protein [Flavobacterium columnare]MBF6654945.1 FeoB-associated Cys-rich membrane protein [Flavobacterium columnare]MBF6657206.1 FeoB-associated Cys-rich membrane protein [Flavobacterium columnare]PTD14174.1 FeoB-associated Cys-rich membrane protein [Flavobacterium columnare]QCV57175.1 FeoB-associated Cys-rich membrane protein [Flavobacterium columnare]
MIQEIVAFLLLILAIAYLYKKFFGKKKPKNSCSNDCNCH